ncbi:glycosyltransferase family 2 protein [Diplocloster modestus]|uniref:Glycosyltransferase n=1 Tax=Diplocloster modestus TaxID=2850322 RepID=A0ABS6K1C0_9FIRM|nr:glycosyltransferase [Diplocloster modestus]MBU9724639.1 glycosyltransferase [Diplocloster modestus]
MIQNIKKTWHYFKRNGITAALAKVSEQLSQQSAERNYSSWLADHLPEAAQLEAQRRHIFINPITFSIIVPTYCTNPTFLQQMVESVLNQTYPYLELCIADGSPDDSVATILSEYQDPRIHYRHLQENNGISGNTNAAFEMATGTYVALLDHDDLLTPDALYEMAIAVESNPATDMMYSDEDKVSADLRAYFNPHYKPDYNPELLRTNNYICHFLAVKRELAIRAGYFRPDYDGAQDYDFIFRCVELAQHIHHIPRILYHWRSHAESTAANPQSKRYAYEAGKRALESHLIRNNIEAIVSHTPHLGFYRVQYRIKITHDSDHCCLHISENAANPPLILKEVKQELISNCMRPDVGIVGGKTLYPNGRIKQAGLRRTSDGTYEPEYNGLKKHFSGYMHRANLQRCVDSVSCDCFAVKLELLDQLGVSPQDLQTQKDVNLLCERIRSAGYLVVFTPYACIKIKDSRMRHRGIKRNRSKHA